MLTVESEWIRYFPLHGFDYWCVLDLDCGLVVLCAVIFIHGFGVTTWCRSLCDHIMFVPLMFVCVCVGSPGSGVPSGTTRTSLPRTPRSRAPSSSVCSSDTWWQCSSSPTQVGPTDTPPTRRIHLSPYRSSYHSHIFNSSHSPVTPPLTRFVCFINPV